MVTIEQAEIFYKKGVLGKFKNTFFSEYVRWLFLSNVAKLKEKKNRIHAI